ncbi:MAG TPA: S41 family peptidase [Candidatus Absconditabacterales bacterium]|nr:S41 family peptidase [Candidatus Absconditabacterales bacterium]
MKRIKIGLLGIGLLGIGFSNIGISSAQNFLNFGEFLTVYFEGISEDVPNTWKYIDVEYDNVRKGTALYQSLQKGIYMDLFPNLDQDLPTDKYLTQDFVTKFLSTKTDNKFNAEKGEKIDTERTKYMIEQSKKSSVGNTRSQIGQNLLNDIIDRLDENYIYPNDISSTKLEYGAIQGYVEAIGDPYTVFFPPKEAKNFEDSLEGEFEGIGAYIEMLKPGVIIISAPIKNSPAEKYGAKAGDVILKVGNNEVDENTSMTDLVNWIKGPSGTFVDIEVLRDGEIKELKIKRDKIVLPNIEYELLDGGNCYMSINQFNVQSRAQFRDAINYFEENNCSKYIFDVRNNPGGGLEDVSYMLDYFVPSSKNIAMIKYKNNESTIQASSLTRKVMDKDVIVLINGGSASASEIFAGVIKDYVEDSLLLGTKTFGKGSVQNLIEYTDGSMFKYTTAKWYTGLSKKNIDGEGIKPDLKLEDNPDTEMDEVLEVAKIYKF